MANPVDIHIWHGHVVYPLTFPYLEAVLRGRPEHRYDMTDPFAAKHPKMPRSKRAKLFAPFDALDGYNESINSKNVQYTEKIELEETDQFELNKKLRILHALSKYNRIAKENRVWITIKYFVPCDDPNIFAYQMKGQYKTLHDICWKVDSDLTQTIKVGEKVICFSDILSIEADDPSIFDVDVELLYD